MDERIETYLTRRSALLNHDDAVLAHLKSLDREFLTRVDAGQLVVPELLPQVGDEDAFLQALAGDIRRYVVVLDIREFFWPGERRYWADRLSLDEVGYAAYWWLLAHYPQLECPPVFPDDPAVTPWAARALWVRGQRQSLPEPWHDWGEALSTGRGCQACAERLWQTRGRDQWSLWLMPLLLKADEAEALRLLNGLGAQVPEATLVYWMGMSGWPRLLPWLDSMRNDPSLALCAERERRWLQGDRLEVSRNQRRWWGKSPVRDNQSVLSRAVRLGFRERLWSLPEFQWQGAPQSLHGGWICTGVLNASRD